jgi:DNA-binding transcriptional regulator GbsR (MarR family)
MDNGTDNARKMAVDALTRAVGFWGVDELEIRVFGTLFLSDSPLSHTGLADRLHADDEDIHAKVQTLIKLGAVKPVAGDRESCQFYEAEADFFQILQTILKERREAEMGQALAEIHEQRAYFEERFEDEGDPELEFLAGRMVKLDNVIKLIDKTMYGLGAVASFRNMFRK